MNPKFIAYIASSIDGIIATGKTKLPDWTSKEDWQFLQGELKKAEAFVMGGNTFKATKRLSRRDNTFVLTRSVKSTKKEGKVTFVNPQGANLKAFLLKFKRVAVLGGGQTYRFMIDKKMIDEIYWTIEPLILGRGIKIFSSGKSTFRLKLLSHKKLNSEGTLILHYKVI